MTSPQSRRTFGALLPITLFADETCFEMRRQIAKGYRVPVPDSRRWQMQKEGTDRLLRAGWVSAFRGAGCQMK